MYNSLDGNLPLIIQGLSVTIQLTITAAVAGGGLGFLLAWAYWVPCRGVRWFSMLYMKIFCSIPLVIGLFLAYLLVPLFMASSVRHLSAFPFVPDTDFLGNTRFISVLVAFVLFEAAYFAVIFRACIARVVLKYRQAGLALGMTHRQLARFIIFPVVFREAMPQLLTQFIALFQDTTLVFFVGLVDFFRAAFLVGKSGSLQVEMILFTALTYFVLCFCLSRLAGYLKKRAI